MSEPVKDLAESITRTTDLTREATIINKMIVVRMRNLLTRAEGRIYVSQTNEPQPSSTRYELRKDQINWSGWGLSSRCFLTWERLQSTTRSRPSWWHRRVSLCDQTRTNNEELRRRRTRQTRTCLVLENSCLAGPECHAERSAISIYNDVKSREQCRNHQTHLKYEEHIETIEKGREYLVED